MKTYTCTPRRVFEALNVEIVRGWKGIENLWLIFQRGDLQEMSLCMSIMCVPACVRRLQHGVHSCQSIQHMPTQL